MQRALVVEHHQVAVAEPEAHLESGIPQQARERAIRRVERVAVVGREVQGCDRAIVVVHGDHPAPCIQPDQRLLGIELGAGRAIQERDRRRRKHPERLGVGLAQVLGEGEAVAEQAVATVGRGDEDMQCLESGDRIPVRVVRVQPEPEIGIGEVLGAHDGSHVEQQAVVRLGDPAGVAHRVEDRPVRGRDAG